MGCAGVTRGPNTAPPKTIYNRFIRWSRIFAAAAGERRKPDQLMIDATHLKAHRTAASRLKKGDVPRRIGRTKGELNSKLHAVCDGHGRSLIMLLSEGQMSDYKYAALMIDAFPKAKTLASSLKPCSTTASTRSRTCSKEGLVPDPHSL
jgi:transposase